MARISQVFLPVFAAGHEVLLVDELDGVDAGGRTVEDELRLFHDLPDSDAAIAASGADGPFADAGVDAGYPVLVTEP